jgi:hypothetical protein
MTDFGVTPTGFNRKQLTDILSDITTKQRAAFGELLDTATATELGQLNGTFASGLAECWELAEGAFHAYDPDAASDYALTSIAGLTGTVRRAAKASTVLLTLNLNAGATVPAGSIVQHSSRPDIRFTTDTLVTNSSGVAAYFPASATCKQTGPIGAIAGSLTVIITPASGWNAVTNSADAIAGRDVDNDITLRQRREDELALRGGSTVSAIKADLLDIENRPGLDGINSAEVLENTGDSPDANGLPPHSFEAIIDDFEQDGVTHQVADPNNIAQAIWESKPGGIPSYGGSSATAIDSTGANQTVRFSYITPRPVYFALTIARTSEYPIDGDAQVKAAIVAKGATLKAGGDVIALVFKALPLGVAGVSDVTALTLGFAPAPVSSANLAVAVRERATFSSLNIVLT